MKQAEEKITHLLNVTPDQAWEVISAVSGVDKWFGSMIKSCRVENDKRFCVTADGKPLNEQILEINHETKTFRFAIPTQELLPVENIIETMKVKDENGKALVEWSGTFDATDENAPIAQEAFRNLWKMGLQEMETFILNQKS